MTTAIYCLNCEGPRGHHEPSAHDRPGLQKRGDCLPPEDFQMQVQEALDEFGSRLAAIEDAVGVAPESARGSPRRTGFGSPQKVPAGKTFSKPGSEPPSTGPEPPKPPGLKVARPALPSFDQGPMDFRDSGKVQASRSVRLDVPARGPADPSPQAPTVSRSTERQSEASLRKSAFSRSVTATPHVRDNERIQLETSMWDASLLISLVREDTGEYVLPILSAILMALSNFVNVVVQMAFILAITTTMSKTPFDVSSQEIMLKERLHQGHSVLGLDFSTASTRTDMMCRGMTHDVLGQTWDAVSDYIPPGDEWPPSVPGVLIALMVMFIWVAKMAVEIRRALDLLLAILFLPPGSPEVREDEDGRMSVISMPFRHKVFLTLFVNLPRLLLDLALLVFGLEYLAFTPDVRDIILNACALQIVDDIDEFMFSVIASKYVFVVMEQTSISVVSSGNSSRLRFFRPETVDDIKPRRACWMIGRAMFVVGALCTGWFMFLMPFLDQVHSVRRIMCGEDRDFVYLVHPATNLPVFAKTETMQDHNLCLHAAFEELIRIRAGFGPLYVAPGADEGLFERMVGSDLSIVRSEELQRMSDASSYASELCRDQDVTLQVVRQTCLNFTVFGDSSAFLESYETCAALGQACRCPAGSADASSGLCSDVALGQKAQENNWFPEWMYILRSLCPQTCGLC